MSLDLSSSQVAAAIVTSVVALLVSCTTALITVIVAERKLRRDHRQDFAAERVAHSLLTDGLWRLRSFEIIKHHLGGYDDEALRQVLVRAGAIRFHSRSGTEVWGLLSRNGDRLGVKRIDDEPGWRYTVPDEVLPPKDAAQ